MTTISDADFTRLVSFVRERYGINLANKRQLIDARLSFDLQRRGYNDFKTYVKKVIEEPDGDECHHMVNKLSTNYTFFFRETDFIGQLEKIALPSLLSRGKSKLKVWSAACSSGQEAYSGAMVLESYKSRSLFPFDYEITGTDINTEMLRIAAEGVYTEDDLTHIPKHYLPYIHRRANGAFTVADELRKKLRWRYENLLHDMDTGYDLVFCRNVMIYFTPELRRDMTVKLFGSLSPGAYLFTGATESIDLERRYFRYIAPAFYQKRQGFIKE